MGRLFNLVWLAGFVLLTGGCAAPGPAQTQTPAPARANRTAPPVNPPTPTPSPADKRFIIAPELQKILHVVNVRLNHPEGSYLEMQVTLENMTDARQQFEYHIEWFDADGVSLSKESPEYVPWMLLPREVVAISVKAAQPTAADFEIAFVPVVK